jgi:seryl-tRNA synthetase
MSIEAAALVFSGISALSDTINLWRLRQSQLQQQQHNEQQQQQQQQQQGSWMDGLTTEQRERVDSLHERLKTASARENELEQEITILQGVVNEASVTILAHVIDDSLLRVRAKNISKAQTRLMKALEDPANSSQTRDNELAIASSAICAELRRLRQLNNDSLPPSFVKVWLSHGCT